MNFFVETKHLNKSAYVALLCLIAFIIVITACIIKQFIWDPLLSKYFATIQPIISESIRKLTSSFLKVNENSNSNLSVPKSFSDTFIKINGPPLLSLQNFVTIKQTSTLHDIQNNLAKRDQPSHSYDSSLNNPHAYTNYALDDLVDSRTDTPLLNFSIEYNPLTTYLMLNIQNLRHMNLFHNKIQSTSLIFIRITLSVNDTNEIYESSKNIYQDSIYFNETIFTVKHRNQTQRFNYHIQFSIMSLHDNKQCELADGKYSMRDDRLKNLLFIERTLPMHQKSVGINIE